MRWSWGRLGVVLLVMGLVICYSDAWGTEWKEFAAATTGTFHYDASSIISPSKDVVRVWIHNATKHESSLIELNCKDKSYHVLDFVQYDEALRMQRRDDYYDNPIWLNISRGSVPEPLYQILCP